MGGTLLGVGGAGVVALLIYAAQVAADPKRDPAWSQTWFIAVFIVAALMAVGGLYFLGAIWF